MLEELKAGFHFAGRAGFDLLESLDDKVAAFAAVILGGCLSGRKRERKNDGWDCKDGKRTLSQGRKQRRCD